MSILNTDTQTSPGIGLLPDDVGFSPIGGCIIDIVGLNDLRLTAQISTSRMFYGWTGPDGAFQSEPYLPNTWLRITHETFDPSGLSALLGGGIAKANIRITLYDGDSGSPNPIYVAQFGAGNFPYKRWSVPPQPTNYDFDGGQNLYIGFEDQWGTPVNCGYMGETTTYRLDESYATVASYTGFPGVFALTDPVAIHPHGFTTPPFYYPPDTPFPVTGWFSVPEDQLATFWTSLLTGTIQVGVHDVTPGDQFYDFMQGLAADVQNIPLLPIVTEGPTLSCNNPPSGVAGMAYSHRLEYAVHTDTYTLALTGGALPDGLTFSELGYITGIPTVAGDFGFAATLTDSEDQAVAVTCSIQIDPPPAGFGNVAF